MAGKVEVYKDSSSKYRWQLKAGNGEVVAGERFQVALVREDGRAQVRQLEAVPEVFGEVHMLELVSSRSRAVGP